MTFEEGLQVLKIDASASAQQARRAYLKLVKVHKPERDPEGFQRVREAFDCVRDTLKFREQFRVQLEQDVQGGHATSGALPSAAGATTIHETAVAELAGTAEKNADATTAEVNAEKAEARSDSAPVEVRSDSVPAEAHVDAAPVEAGDDAASSTIPSDAAPGEARSEPARVEAVPSFPEASGDTTLEPPESAFEAYMAQAQAAAEAGGPDAAVEVWREGLARYPQAEDFIWELVDVLEEAEREQEAMELMHQAAQQGLEAFRATLLWRYPKRVPLDFLTTAAKEPELQEAAIHAWVERGAGSEAAALLKQRFKQAAGSWEGLSIPVNAALRTMALCIAEGRVALAKQLAERFEVWLRESGTRSAEIGSQEVARWVLVGELVQAAEDLPLRVRKPLATAVVMDDSSLPVLELIRFRDEQPGAADQAYHILVARAPTLARAYGEHLQRVGPTPSNPAPKKSFGNWTWVFGIIMASQLMRVVMRGYDADEGPTQTIVRTPVDIDPSLPATRRPSAEPARPIVGPPADTATGEANPDVVEKARLEIERSAQEHDQYALELLVNQVAEAFKSPTCTELHQSFGELVATTREADPKTRENVQFLWAEYLVQCPNLPREAQ